MLIFLRSNGLIGIGRSRRYHRLGHHSAIIALFIRPQYIYSLHLPKHFFFFRFKSISRQETAGILPYSRLPPEGPELIQLMTPGRVSIWYHTPTRAGLGWTLDSFLFCYTTWWLMVSQVVQS